MEIQEKKEESVGATVSPMVKDLMTTELFTLYPEDGFQVIDILMKWKKIRHIPVIDDQQRLQGLITQRDYLKAAVSSLADVKDEEKNQAYKTLKVEQIMTREVSSVSPYTLLSTAARIMVENKFGCLPVVENERLVGIITEADFVKSFYNWEVQFFN